MYVCVCLHVYVCTMCVPDAHGDQKRALDPLELDYSSCEPTCGSWEPNLGTLEEPQVFLTIFPAPKGYIFFLTPNLDDGCTTGIFLQLFFKVIVAEAEDSIGSEDSLSYRMRFFF